MKTPPPELADRLWEVGDQILAPGREVRIDDLSELTGTPRATLYYYFGGKDDVIAFLLAQKLERGTKAIAEAAALEGSGAQRLEAALRALLRVYAEHEALCTRMLGWMAIEGAAGQVMAQAQDAVIGPLRDILIAGQADGSLAVFDPTEGALVAMGSVTIVAMMHTVGGTLDADAVADRVVPQLLEGFAARG
ncbi:MAG: TetR family transcriptional regulator [Actinobacteria bacterium]|nr:TetR family transcriptional regulator [Actinomycetota bacterium]